MYKRQLFTCDRCKEERRNLENVVGQISPENIIGIMLESDRYWAQVAAYIESVSYTHLCRPIDYLNMQMDSVGHGFVTAQKQYTRTADTMLGWTQREGDEPVA